MGSAFQLLPSAQPMGSAPEIGAHLKAAEGAPGSGAQFTILSTLRVSYSLHFASSLFFTLCEFVILYTLQVRYSLHFPSLLFFIFCNCLYLYTNSTSVLHPRGPGAGAGGPMGGA